MAGTNAVAVKKELFRRLALEPRLAGVQVTYRFPGNLVDECVYGGRVAGPMSVAAMRSAGGRQPREEEPIIQVHIRVLKHGDVTSEADERAAELATIVAELVAADPLLSGAVPGLLNLYAADVDIDSGPAGDGDAEAIATLQLVAHSFLT